MSLSTLYEDCFFRITQYLCLRDIVCLEASNTWFMALCRNPKAISRLQYPDCHINNFEDNRYSGIKRLDIIRVTPALFRRRHQIIKNINWQSRVRQLILYGSDCRILQNFQTDSLERFSCAFPSDTSLIPSMCYINKNTLTVLELFHIHITVINGLANAIAQCIHLEKVSLFLLWTGTKTEVCRRIDGQIYSRLIDNNQPLNKLQHFETYVSSMNNIPNWFHWFLCGRRTNKHLVMHNDPWVSDIRNPICLFDASHRSVHAFKTLANITITSEMYETPVTGALLSALDNICYMARHFPNDNNVVILAKDMIYLDGTHDETVEPEHIDSMLSIQICQPNLFYQFDLNLFDSLHEHKLPVEPEHPEFLNPDYVNVGPGKKQRERVRSEWMLDQILNGNRIRWFETFTVAFNVRYQSGQFPDHKLIDSCQTEHDLTHLGTRIALSFLDDYYRFIQPWLLSVNTMDTMGIRCLEVILAIGDKFECLMPRDRKLKLFWKEKVIPKIEEEVQKHVSDAFILDTSEDTICANLIKFNYRQCRCRSHPTTYRTMNRKKPKDFYFR
eukprot:739739_1